MKNKIMPLVLAIAMSVMCLSGCGSNDSNAENNESASASETGNSEESIVVRAAHTGNENTVYQVGMVAFKEYVEENSNGKYTVDIYPSTLGGDSDLYEGLQIGTVDFAEVNTSVISNTVEDLKVLDLPFLFSSREEAYAVLDGEVGDSLLEEIDAQCGIKSVCFWENGFRNFTNDVRPIKHPDDLKDLNMRCMQSDSYMSTFENWGCNISVMNISETITAMQSGVIDGHDNNPDTVVSNSMWEYQDYFSDSRHFYSAKTLNFSLKFWDTLSEEDKAMFIDAAKHARDVEREECIARYEAALEKLASNGMTVIANDEIDVEAFKESVQPIWEKYEDTLGDLIVKVQEVTDSI